MNFIITSILLGILSGIVSICFRLYEIGNEKILVGTQFFVQIILFGISVYIVGKFFSDYSLSIGSITLGWFFVFFLLSSLVYYMVQVLFEWKSRIPLFPTEQEIEDYIERNMQ